MNLSATYFKHALPILVFAIAVFSAGYFGLVTSSAQNVLTGSLTILAILVLAFAAFSHTKLPPVITLIVALAAAILGWAVIQSFPLSPAWAHLAHPFWNQASTLLNTPLQSYISVVPISTFNLSVIGAMYIAWVLFVALSAQWISPSKLLKSLALAGALICSYGLIVYATGNSTILFLPKEHYLDSLTATFVNRNSFATFAGLTLLINLAVLFENIGELHRYKRESFTKRAHAAYKLILKPRWPWIFPIVISMLTLTLSNSRAGMAWSLVGALTLIILLLKRHIIISLILASSLALIVVGLIGETLVQRGAHINADYNTRASIYSTTLEVWKENPILGTGLGSFENIFRIHKTIDLAMNANAVIDRAHSTPLQLLLELGLVGILGLTAILLITIASLIIGLRTRRSKIVYPALGLAALAQVLGHSFFDFSLEIPGVTILFLGVMTLALTLSFKTAENTPSSRSIQFSLYAAFILILAASSYFAISQYQQGRTYYEPLKLIRSHALTGTPLKNSEIHKTLTALTPGANQPEVASQMAVLNADLAQRTKNSAMKEVYFNLSDLYARKSLALNPLNPAMWHRLSIAQANLGHTPQAIQYWHASQQTGPLEPLAWQRIPFSLYLYANASPQDKPIIQASLIDLWKAGPYKAWSIYRNNPSIMRSLAKIISSNSGAVASFERLTGTPISKFLAQ